jgi:hypothetical protein
MIIARERPPARGARRGFEEEQEEDDAVPALRCIGTLSFTPDRDDAQAGTSFIAAG